MLLDEKICPPALNMICRRPRLLDLLTDRVQSTPQIVTVYTPSGYGKSTLLADFAHTTHLPVCWCSLDTPEKNPREFLKLLHYSLINRFYDRSVLHSAKTIATVDTQMQLNDILALMNKVSPHVIIIDDYHKAANPGLTLTLNRLFQLLPGPSSIILASQVFSDQNKALFLSLPMHLAGTTLSIKDLRFTAEEIQLVMLKRFGQLLNSAEARKIADVTDGHIGRILLAGQTMRRKSAPRDQEKSGNRQLVYYCLAEDIFRKQPPKLQQFMLQTSVLPAVTAEMCNQLLDQDDAHIYLDELIRKELVVSKGKQSFIYPESLAEFLRFRLNTNSLLRHQLSIKAAEILINQSQLTAGLQIYLAAEAWDEAIILLQDKGKFLRDTGQGPALYQWLTQIPIERLVESPSLLLLQGQLLNDDLGSPKSALKTFRQAEAQFLQKQDSIGAVIAKMGQAVTMAALGQRAEALDLAMAEMRQLLEASPARSEAVAWTKRNYGLVYLTSGDIEKALTVLRQALAIFEQLGDNYYQGLCHLDIGHCLRRLDHLNGAAHHQQQALENFEALGNAYGLAKALNSFGTSLCGVGQYKEALQKLEESLSLAYPAGATHQVAVAQSGMGDVYLAQGNYGQAIESYTQVIKYAHKAEIHPLEVANLMKLAECFYYQHNFTKALTIVKQAYEIANEKGLTHEIGLAHSLQGRIYMRQGLYVTSFDFFGEALEFLAENAILAQTKVRLWWAYALFLDLRVSAAFDQFKEALRLAFMVNERWSSLTSTLRETQQLLFHFLYWVNTPPSLKDSIPRLIKQIEQNINVSRESLQVFMFGTPTLIVSGQCKRFTQRGRPSKLPELLAYMLIEGQNGGCRWAEVAGAIWPELSTEKASAIFHQSIRRLRDTFFDAPDYILVQDDYYQINPVYCEWCDILTFERLYHRLTYLSSEAALPLQLELIDLYQGEFLRGFDIDEEWGTIHRTEYEKRFLWTVKAASRQLLGQGLIWKALDILQKGIRHNYLQEDLHHEILEAYARLGLYSEMRSHYEQVVKTFKDDLGHPPDVALRNHFQRLISTRGDTSTKVESVHRSINTL